MINSGPKKEATDLAFAGEAATFDIMRVRRIQFLHEDGTIDRPIDPGWRPGQGR
jgi:hypothetical protein